LTKAEQDHLLIVGIPKIAQILNLSQATVKRDFIKRPDFPAAKLSANGPWVTTREDLKAWIKAQISGRSVNPS